jgi:CheY-like chemotaxis protein
VLNGQELIDEIKVNSYDVILADIRMPVLGGIEAVKQIRGFNTEIPIIAQTANAFEEDKRLAMEAGCNAFVTKPVKLKHLVKTIESLVD